CCDVVACFSWFLAKTLRSCASSSAPPKTKLCKANSTARFLGASSPCSLLSEAKALYWASSFWCCPIQVAKALILGKQALTASRNSGVFTTALRCLLTDHARHNLSVASCSASTNESQVGCVCSTSFSIS